MWGKEAGWAHSVLFTADLRAFAGRLVMKAEVADMGGVKTEEEEEGLAAAEEKENVVVAAKREMRVKRELEEAEELKPLALHEHEDMMSSIKRRRRRRRRA